MKIKLFGLLLLVGVITHAQTWEEWTRQKKVAIKRLVQQIAANQVAIEYGAKGYGILKDGVNASLFIQQSDFTLHKGQMDSLKIVQAVVKRSASEVFALFYRVVQIVMEGRTLIQSKDALPPEERSYCRSVLDKVNEDCTQTMQTLRSVLTSGELSMSDDQRLHRIAQVSRSLQHMQDFLISLCQEIQLLILQRLTEKTDISFSQKLNGLR